jgi:hypothetical protein
MPAQEAFNRAAARAAALPAPGPLAAALAAAPKVIGPWTLRPFTAADFVVLQLLESPLIALLIRAAAPDPSDQSNQSDRSNPPESVADTLEALWLLTHTPREARALLAAGRPAYRERALADLTESPDFNPTFLAEAQQHLALELVRCLTTWVDYRAPKAEGDTTVFTQPGPPPTASAGSLKPSAP